MIFSTVYEDILKKIDAIDPIKYGGSRNFTDGDITYLSPYISRGMICAKQLLTSVLLRGYTIEQVEKFVQQLAWREYFQRTWQFIGDDMFEDIRLCNTGIQHKNIPTAIIEANTGIHAIDEGIKKLYQTGYIHNHLRMYIASITCNIGKAYWKAPSQWMYYHLLDGDLASNTCSWQWVAGNFSTKQYYCNQENINKYTNTDQQNTFLDKPYDELPLLAIPKELKITTSFKLKTNLPVTAVPEIDPQLPLLIYNSYNLDPEWRKNIRANRILLLEPSHFKNYPVSDAVVAFIISLSKNISGLQIFTGEVNEIPLIKQCKVVCSKEHPAFTYYPGKKDEREWLFPEVNGLPKSFFNFWKKCKKYLKAYPAMWKEELLA